MAGRPSKLTDELKTSLLARLREGQPIAPSCEVEGIDSSTFRKWRIQARDGIEPYASFFTEVARARAEGELKHWEVATTGDEPEGPHGASRNAQWALTVGYGRRYQQRINVKVEEETELLLDVVERVCSAKDCGCHAAILEALSARDRGEETEGTPGEPIELH